MSDRREREAVGFEEHEQLRRDHAALQEQFAAADEVLSAIGRSAGDPEKVLSTIVESARRLCRSQTAFLYLLQDGYHELITSTGASEEAIGFIAEHPMAVDRETLIGRVGLERRTTQITDVLTDPEYGAFDLQRIGGYRTTMGAPHASRRRGRGHAQRLAHGGRPVRRARDVDRHGLCGSGRAGDQRREAGAGAGGTACRAREAGRGARGVARGRRGRELEPGRRSRALHDRHARREAVRHGRRLDHGVRRAGSVLPGAQRLPDPIRGRRTAVFDPHRSRRVAGRADGRYDPSTALFLTPRGHEKHLVATDHLESDLLRGLSVSDLFDIVARHGLHFDQSRQVGIVFHMISCITELGRIGLTAVGDSPAEADKRYREAERVLLEEARASLEEAPLPV